jgi:hypothetical protein
MTAAINQLRQIFKSFDGDGDDYDNNTMIMMTRAAMILMSCRCVSRPTQAMMPSAAFAPRFTD